MKHFSTKTRFILEVAAFFCVAAMFVVNTAVKMQPLMDTYSYNENDPPRTVARQTHAISEWAEGFGPPEEAESSESLEEPSAEAARTDEPPQTTASAAADSPAQPQESTPAPPEYTRVELQSSMSITIIKRPEGPLNINTATLAELMELDGIGLTKGKAIISYREEHGAFSSVDELLNVKGIGEKTLEKLREFITV